MTKWEGASGPRRASEVADVIQRLKQLVTNVRKSGGGGLHENHHFQFFWELADLCPHLKYRVPGLALRIQP